MHNKYIMKSTNKMIFLILIFNSLINLISTREIKNLPEITFSDKAETELSGTGIFKIVANYKTDVSQKYLYIYPKNFDSDMYLNKAIFKIYFKEQTNEEADANYLDSDYSTLDFNSGLFIAVIIFIFFFLTFYYFFFFFRCLYFC